MLMLHRTIILALLVAPNIYRWALTPQDLTPAFGILTSLLLGMALMSQWRWSERKLVFVFGVLCLGAVIDLVHLIDYGAHIGPGGLAVIFDSHSSETREFLTLVSLSAIPVGSIYLGLLTLAWFLARNKAPAWSKKQHRIGLALIAIVAIDFIGKGSSAFSYPLSLLKAGNEYITQAHRLAEFQARSSRSNFEAVKTTTIANEIHVLVIGESLRRDHMGIYGYQRDTTPFLSRTPDIVKYTDIISGATQTRNAMKMILSPAEPTSLELFYTQGNLIQLAREAGFDVAWLSNQGQYGKHDTEVTKIAIDASYRSFTNTDWETDSLDEKLLPRFERVLIKRPRPLLIVVHLLGSHSAYERRYPPSHAIFPKKGDVYETENGSRHMRMINHYDNSVHYSDWILQGLLTRYRAAEPHGCLVFTADHAEYLGDEEARYGHGFPSPRRQELEPPLLVTCSKIWQETNPALWNAIQDNAHKPTSNTQLFQGMAQLMGIHFPAENPASSPFSPDYQPSESRLALTPDGKVFVYEELGK